MSNSHKSCKDEHKKPKISKSQKRIRKIKEQWDNEYFEEEIEEYKTPKGISDEI